MCDRGVDRHEMEFERWEPVYETILAEFGFDRAEDERSRDLAARFAEPFAFDRLAWIEDATVAIVGAAPTLPDELEASEDPLAAADGIVAASTAVDVLEQYGYETDLMVTDLDKNTETAIDRTHDGRPVVAHAHGDNQAAVRSWFPRADTDHVLATTQAAPQPAVHNFGGFTDGDRAAFLADAFGADRLRFVGWQFDDPTPDPTKAHKLEWAARLLRWLERRRDERFSVLDGHRESIEPPAIED